MLVDPAAEIASGVFVIFASAAIFAAQHHRPSCRAVRRGRHVPRAGLYLAGLYFFRGFGIAAGCHSFYNVIVITLEAVHD
jgi:hypothetical protein